MCFVLEKNQCHPNLCQNNGTCVPFPNGTSLCDCTATRFTGKYCHISQLIIPNGYIVTKNQTSQKFMIYAKPDEQLDIAFSSKISEVYMVPSKVTITAESGFASFQVVSKVDGIHEVFILLSGRDQEKFEAPTSVFVVVKSEWAIQDDDLITENGTLKHLCIQHVGSDIIQKKSSDGQVLPLSFSGGTYEGVYFKSSALSRSLAIPRNSSTNQCLPNGTSLQLLISLNVFKSTVIDLFNQKSPYWIKIIDQKENFSFWVDKDFQGDILKGAQIRSDSCVKGLEIVDDHDYYIYRTNQSMRILLPTGHFDATLNTQKCFIKNLKNGSIHFSLFFEKYIILPLIFARLIGNTQYNINQFMFHTAFHQRITLIGYSTFQVSQKDLYLELSSYGTHTIVPKLFSDKIMSNAVDVYTENGKSKLNMTMMDFGKSFSIILEGTIKSSQQKTFNNSNCKNTMTHFSSNLSITTSSISPNQYSIYFSEKENVELIFQAYDHQIQRTGTVSK